MWLVLVHAAAVWFMTGVIWTMQVLHYPLLARVRADSFTGYEQAHNARFARVVGPSVSVTALTTVGLLLAKPAELGWAAPITVILLLTVVIASTILVQAPAHARLARRFDPVLHSRLVRSNWVRTAAWTALGALDLWMLVLTR